MQTLRLLSSTVLSVSAVTTMAACSAPPATADVVYSEPAAVYSGTSNPDYRYLTALEAAGIEAPTQRELRLRGLKVCRLMDAGEWRFSEVIDWVENVGYTRSEALAIGYNAIANYCPAHLPAAVASGVN